MYSVKISEKALKALKNLDKQIARMIIAWIEKNLEGTNKPRDSKGLSHDKKVYGMCNYRILANVIDDELIILMIDLVM